MAQLVLGPLLRHVDEQAATVWVEVDEPCEVEVLGCAARSFTVEGHHYALVVCDGLEPGTARSYQVHLDGEPAWPEPGSSFPPSRIRTRDGTREEPLRLVFGSCRVTRPHHPPHTGRTGKQGVGPDALHAYAVQMLGSDPSTWPDALLLVGDQVYADEPSPGTVAYIRGHRDVSQPPGEGVANFHEYTVLYQEAWSDPTIRWVLSTVPTSMVFDDHDVHDDWNTSAAWRRDMQAKSWWPARIEGGLMAYWLYQHLGNLRPFELADDETYRRVREVEDGGAVLRAFAAEADREADGGKPYRWSYRRDFGGVRMLVVDSRCGRVLDSGERSMVDEAEWRWIVEQVQDCPDHLLIASSLPVLLPPAISGLESWDEALCDGAWGRRWARWGEVLRRAADLEHWAAFRRSFDALVELVAEVGAGARGDAPASITFLGGDVHFSYLAKASYPPGRGVTSRVHQVVCSPVRNPVQRSIRGLDRLARTAVGRGLGRALLRSVRVRPSELSWQVDHGPWFDNQLATVAMEGRSARVWLEQPRAGEPDPSLERVFEHDLTPD